MDQHCLFGCSVHCLLSSIYQLFTSVGENLPLFLFLSFWKGVGGKGDGVLFFIFNKLYTVSLPFESPAYYVVATGSQYFFCQRGINFTYRMTYARLFLSTVLCAYPVLAVSVQKARRS